MLKLNLGCGNCTPEGWVNVDYAFGARLARIPGFRLVNRRFRLFNLTWNSSIRIHDLRKTFPWDDGSIDCIYTSHTFEHFTREEGIAFLSECSRVLKVGGILRVVVPDLKRIVDKYARGELAAENFLNALGVLYEQPSGRISRFLIHAIQFPHKCMYDDAALLRQFTLSGIEGGLREPFDSDIADIRDIESNERAQGSLIAEGRKV